MIMLEFSPFSDSSPTWKPYSCVQTCLVSSGLQGACSKMHAYIGRWETEESIQSLREATASVLGWSSPKTLPAGLQACLHSPLLLELRLAPRTTSSLRYLSDRKPAYNKSRTGKSQDYHKGDAHSIETSHWLAAIPCNFIYNLTLGEKKKPPQTPKA